MSSFYNITNPNLNNNNVQLYVGDITVNSSYNTSILTPIYGAYLSTPVSSSSAAYTFTSSDFTVIKNRGGFTQNTSNIVIPLTGTYEISLIVNVYGSGNIGLQNQVDVIKNGSRIITTTFETSTNTVNAAYNYPLHSIVNLTAGDIIHFKFTPSSSSPYGIIAYQSGAAIQTNFFIKMV